MDFKVAYTSHEDRIVSGLAKGLIDNGDMILITDSIPYHTLNIVDPHGRIIKVTSSIRKFDSIQLAYAWLADVINPVEGEPIVILENDKYKMYMINKVGTVYEIEPVSGSEYSIDGETIISNDGVLSVAKLAHKLTIGNKEFDGSKDVTVDSTSLDVYTTEEVDEKIDERMSWKSL